MPYIGVFLTDLTFMDESATDRYDDGLLNFAKLQRLHERLADIMDLQKGKYDFVPQSMIQCYLRQAQGRLRKSSVLGVRISALTCVVHGARMGRARDLSHFENARRRQSIKRRSQR